MSEFSEFLRGFLVAILFAECDLNREDENDDTSLQDEGFTPEDFTDDARAALRAEALAFYWRNRRTLRAAYAAQPAHGAHGYGENAYTPERAGHDLYFTSAGHGVGYWDRGLGDIGRALSDACPGYREFCAYVNDAGRVDID